MLKARYQSDFVHEMYYLQGEEKIGVFKLEFEPESTQAKLYNVRVEPPDHGYGTQMLTEAIEYALSMGMETIWLNVVKDNLRAQHVYQKLGWKFIRKDEGVWAYEMILDLTERRCNERGTDGDEPSHCRSCSRCSGNYVGAPALGALSSQKQPH